MERSVPYTEQRLPESEGQAVTEVAAPMVECAFQLLDLLMVTDHSIGSKSMDFLVSAKLL